VLPGSKYGTRQELAMLWEKKEQTFLYHSFNNLCDCVTTRADLLLLSNLGIFLRLSLLDCTD